MNHLIYTTILSFAGVIILGFFGIPLLRRLRFGQYIREDGPKSHLKKAGTPTMGGVFLLLPVIIAAIIMTKKDLTFTLVVSFITIGFASLGFIDDYIKVVKKQSEGLKPKQKILGQLGLGLILSAFVWFNPSVGSEMIIPFFGVEINMGLFIIPIILFTTVGTTNAVNLTDGADGLASGVTMVVAIIFVLITDEMSVRAAMAGRHLQAVNYAGLTVFSAALGGGCLGFMFYNAYPAKVMMGDTGSMGLGGAVVTIAVLLKMPLILLLVGAVYVIEALSVIIQVFWYKRTKKRVFRMSPIHHHFELAGMDETRVVAMFIIASALFGLLGLLAI